MEKLLQGIEQFRDRVYPKYRVAFKNLEHGQNPLALFITCADSRIDPSLLMQTDPGDLFICRNAGNLVPPYTEDGAVEATVEIERQANHGRSLRYRVWLDWIATVEWRPRGGSNSRPVASEATALSI